MRTQERLLYNHQNRKDPDNITTDQLDSEIQKLKETVAWKSEELDLRLRCLREQQMSQNKNHSVHYNESKAAELRLVSSY